MLIDMSVDKTKMKPAEMKASFETHHGVIESLAIDNACVQLY
jgi:hypothetical protein